MQVHADDFKAEGGKDAKTMTHLLCHVMSGVCHNALGGDACKKSLRDLNDKLDKSGPSLPLRAAYAGRVDLIKILMEVGANIDKPDTGLGVSPLGEGWTPLMIAAAEGHPDVVSMLISAGANVNSTNKAGRTPLMFASNAGFAGIVSDLVSHGANPNIVPTDDTGWTALIAAANNGHIDIVRVLLEHGADVGIADKKGETALSRAGAQGHTKVVRLLKSATRTQAQ